MNLQRGFILSINRIDQMNSVISIIIATKDRPDFIKDLLFDISNQSKKIFEVIISDQSENFIELKNIFNFNLIHFQNKGNGPCCSRNEAISKSNGEILVFIDDDSRIEKNFIEEITFPILNNISDTCAGAICDSHGNYKFIKKEKNSLNDPFHWIIPFTKNPNHPFTQYCSSAPAGCLAIKKEVFIEIGLFDEFFDPNGAGEDRELALRLILNGFSIYYNGKAKLFHFAASSGGRRQQGSTPLYFQINIGYIIYKHLGKSEFSAYKKKVILWRLTKILKMKSPRYNFKSLLHILNGFNRIKLTL